MGQGELTEWLFLDDSGVLLWLINDGRLHEVALAAIDLTTNSYLLARLLDVIEEATNTLELHLVLDGAQEDTALVPLTVLQGLGELNSGSEELVIYALVDINALQGQANLSRVEEGEGGNLSSGGLDVDICAHNGWVIAAELQSDTLESLGGRLHNLLTSECGAGEGDLVNARVGCEPWAKVVIAADNLDDTGWEEVLGKLAELQVAVRSEGRWLDDDGAANQDSRGNLADSKLDGEVPWDDTDGDTDGSITDDDLAVAVLLNLLIFDLVLGEAIEPGTAGVDLTLRQVEGLTLLGNEEVGELFAVLAESDCVVSDGLLSLLIWDFGPGGECLAGSSYGSVDIFWGAHRDFGIGLLGGRVDVMTGLSGGGELAVDGVVEGGKIELLDAVGGHVDSLCWLSVGGFPVERWEEVLVKKLLGN
jgi:hypothetical protein